MNQQFLTSYILLVDDVEDCLNKQIPLYPKHSTRVIKNDEKDEFQIAQAQMAIKEAYIATGVMIACFIDFTRLSVYITRFSASSLNENLVLVISATLSAIFGAYIGMMLLKKVTFRRIQILVAIMLIAISIALAMGLI